MQQLVYKLFRTGDRHPRQSGVNSAYLYGRGAYRGAYAANRDFQKIKPATVLPYSLILTAIGFGLLTASPGFIRAATGMVLVGMGLSSTYPVILSILGTRYPALSGTAFSIALAIALVGQAAMNGLMGMVSVYAGGIVFYPYIMIGSLIIMLILFKRSLK